MPAISPEGKCQSCEVRNISYYFKYQIINIGKGPEDLAVSISHEIWFLIEKMLMIYLKMRNKHLFTFHRPQMYIYLDCSLLYITFNFKGTGQKPYYSLNK